MWPLALALMILIADQASKIVVREHMMVAESFPVVPGLFNLSHVSNTGAVWGILQSQNEWLAIFSLLVLVLMLVFYRWLVDNRGIHRLAIGCLIGGILGNLVDRVKFGAVTDFLDFHIGAHHWPTFNVADAAICIGVFVYMLSALRPAHQPVPPAEATEPASAAGSEPPRA